MSRSHRTGMSITVLILVLVIAVQGTAFQRARIDITTELTSTGVNIKLTSTEPINVTTHRDLGGRITFYIDRLNIAGKMSERFEDVPLVVWVSVEPLSPKGGKIVIETEGIEEYSFIQGTDKLSLTINLAGGEREDVGLRIYREGEAARLSGDNMTALERYRSAIRIKNGDYPVAYFGIGLIRAEMGQHKLSIGSFKKTLDDDSLKEEALYRLSDLFDKIGKPGLAKEYLALAEGREYVPTAETTTQGPVTEGTEVTPPGEIVTTPEDSTSFTDKITGAAKTYWAKFSEILPSWEILRVVLLVVVLLAPAVLLLIISLRGKKAKKQEKTLSTEEFTAQLKSAIEDINEEIVKTEEEEPQEERPSVRVQEGGAGSLHTTLSWENRSRTQGRIQQILSLRENDLSEKEIAQELGISVNEVMLTLEMGKLGADLLTGGSAAGGIGMASEEEIKEIAKDLHRDEEEVKLGMLAKENLE